jgi:aldehyde dehydrogenase (NAD+)
MPQVKMGPLVSSGQYNKVLSLIQSGIDQGATLVCGGGKIAPHVPDNLVGKFSQGYYVAPTIFSNVKPFMKIWQEEIFGPVLSIMVYENETGRTYWDSQ